MAKHLTKINVLLVDPDELQKFLHSCAATEVLFKDTKIITEPTGLLWFGIGQYFPGGTAQRLAGSLSPNEQRVLAVAGCANLNKAFVALLDHPAKEQIDFLLELDKARNKQRAQLSAMAAQVEGVNATTDEFLKAGLRSANQVQSVACIALAVLATGGGIALAGGATSLGSLGLATATSGKLFVVILGTKSIIGIAQSDHDLKSLAGFAIGTFKDGALALGELSSKAFELIKDATINSSRNRMGRATADYLAQMMAAKDRIAVLQNQVYAISKRLDEVKPGSGLAKGMEAEAKALNAEIAQLRASIQTAGEGAVGASKTGQFMKNFGGKAVPLISLAIDVVLEVQRYQDVDAQIESSGYGKGPPARRH